MELSRRIALRGLNRNAYGASILVLLVLLVALTTLSSATSSCPSASSFPVICYCTDSSRTERITTRAKLLEAREDPTSCCYSRTADPKVVRPEHITFTYVNNQNTNTQEAMTDLPPIVKSATISDESKRIVIASSPPSTIIPTVEEPVQQKIIVTSTMPPIIDNVDILESPIFIVTAIKPDYSAFPYGLVLLLQRLGFDI